MVYQRSSTANWEGWVSEIIAWYLVFLLVVVLIYGG
jgi:hypothetical protein